MKGEEPRVTVGIRISRWEVEQIDAAAERRGWSRSEWVRRVIQRGIVGEHEQILRPGIATTADNRTSVKP